MQPQTSPEVVTSNHNECRLCKTHGEYKTNPLIAQKDHVIYCRECTNMQLLETIAHNLGRIAESLAQK